MAWRQAKGRRKRKRLPDVLSTAELERLVAAPSRRSALGTRAAVLLTLMGRQGLRIGEICRMTDPGGKERYMKTGDLRLDADVPYVIVIGKNNKQRNNILRPATIALLDDWLAIRPYGGDALLPVIQLRHTVTGVSNPGRAISTRQGYETVRRYALKAHIGRPIHPHTLRHACGTHLMNIEGWDIREVQEFLGHADISSTQIYTHISNRRMAERVSKLK